MRSLKKFPLSTQFRLGGEGRGEGGTKVYDFHRSSAGNDPHPPALARGPLVSQECGSFGVRTGKVVALPARGGQKPEGPLVDKP